MTCAFCDPLRVWVRSTETCRATFDGFGLNPGHVLVTPLRHVGHVAELTPVEAAELWQLGLSFLGVGDHTIGVNDGPLAGQTIGHVHLHVIPRVEGDNPQPRGGIRWVVPAKADYWTPPSGECEART